jgi:hypothetical protein
MQDDSGGKVNILGGDSVNRCENMNMYLTLNSYPDKDV